MTDPAAQPPDLVGTGAGVGTGTSERARDRMRRAGRSAVASALARVLSVVVLFASTPLVEQRVGNEAGGLWLLLVTGTALVGFADLGLGNGLVNMLSEARGRDDVDSAAASASSAVVALLALAAVVGMAAALVVPHVNWAALLNVTGGAAEHTTAAVGIFIASVLITMPLAVGQRIHQSCQEGWAAAATVAAGSALSFAGVLLAAWTGAGVEGFVLGMVAGPPIAYAAESVLVYWVRHPELRPRPSLVTPRLVLQVARSGFLFFVLASSVAAAYESDSIVISHYLGAASVAHYALPLRLFMLAPSAVAVVVQPLWPAYGEALARGDAPWAYATLRRSLLLAATLTIPPSLILLVATGPLLRALHATGTRPSASVLLALATWAVVSGISTALAMFLNGANIVRLQVLVSLTMVACNLPASILLVQRIGVAGPAWASSATQTVLVLVPDLLIVRRLMRDTEPLPQWVCWLVGPTAAARPQRHRPVGALAGQTAP